MDKRMGIQFGLVRTKNRVGWERTTRLASLMYTEYQLQAMMEALMCVEVSIGAPASDGKERRDDMFVEAVKCRTYIHTSIGTGSPNGANDS